MGPHKGCILVALGTRLDSSVAAALLLEDLFEEIGETLHLKFRPEVIFGRSCRRAAVILKIAD